MIGLRYLTVIIHFLLLFNKSTYYTSHYTFRYLTQVSMHKSLSMSDNWRMAIYATTKHM